MADRHYEIERTMTKPSTGGTVTPTTTGETSPRINDDIDDDGLRCVTAPRPESKPVLRKRRRTEPASSRTGIPRKTPRRTGEKEPGHPPDERAPEDVPEESQEDVQSETANPPSLARSSRSRVSSDGRSGEDRSAFNRKQLCDSGDPIGSDDCTKQLKEDMEEEKKSVQNETARSSRSRVSSDGRFGEDRSAFNRKQVCDSGDLIGSDDCTKQLKEDTEEEKNSVQNETANPPSLARSSRSRVSSDGRFGEDRSAFNRKQVCDSGDLIGSDDCTKQLKEDTEEEKNSVQNETANPPSLARSSRSRVSSDGRFGEDRSAFNRKQVCDSGDLIGSDDCTKQLKEDTEEEKNSVQNETANPPSLARSSRSRVSSDGRFGEDRSAFNRKQVCDSGDPIGSDDCTKQLKEDMEEEEKSVQNETANPPSLARSSRSRVSSDGRSGEDRSAFNRKQVCDSGDLIGSDDCTKQLKEDMEETKKSVDGCNDSTAEKRSSRKSDQTKMANPAEEHEDEADQLSTKPPMHPDSPRRRLMGLSSINRRDDSARLRKTIQWLEEGARKLREDLAETRSELYEERRAARLARREIEVAVREARAAESAKHQRVIAELKTRLSQSPSRPTTESSPAITKAELLKDENHRREISAAKKRLAEADATIRKLRSSSLDPPVGNSSGKRRKVETHAAAELRKLDGEVKTLRAVNKKMEEKLNIVCMEADRIRIMELRIQHENHEAEINALKKSLRSDAIRMMEEIRSKDREIERLGRLARENRKSCPREDDAMRKLRENENGHQIRLAARIEDKIPQVENVIDLCKGECEAVAEVERLRELAVEQQEVIELLRQAVKEKERKLDQLSNKRRKEEYYKQWLELEPVAEVDDEEEHEEGDSALSSAPSSLSPQPGGCGHWQTNGVTREAYEAVLLEIDQLQTKFLEEQQELAHAKSQVRDLEKALLQETRGSQNSRRALSEKLRKLEDREASLLAEIAELGEQNELLEFRVLELEESPGLRETPDTADSGIVSPEPIHIFREQNNKQRDRAVATVLPFSAYTHPTSPVPVKKTSLSLQESGIFEGDEDDNEDDDDEEEEIEENDREIEFTSCGTQTEAPVGELLQEVQRLQELRERIQERAVKVPSGSGLEVKSTSAMDLTDTKVQDEKSSLYREKIRQLEERLEFFEEEHENKLKNDLVVKQREEDLLDENYRLTERVYWLENELRNFENERKSFADAVTMTEPKNPVVHAETMTRHESFDADTMTDFSKTITSDLVRMPTEEIKDRSSGASTHVHTISRCENIFLTALQENMNESVSASKSSATEMDGCRIEQKLRIFGSNEETIGECVECETLRSDYDAKIEQLAKAECRLRGRLIDLERKEDAFAKTLKQVDVTWSQLEADHAKNLEEIGRRLEEKVECNRRIVRRIAELENLTSCRERKESCSCKCYDASSNSTVISSLNPSPSSDREGVKDGRFLDRDQVDSANDQEPMEVDGSGEKTTESPKTMKQVSRTTQTDREGSFQFPNCSSKKYRICEMKADSPRGISISGLSNTAVPAADLSPEIAVEATEDIEVKTSTKAETDGTVSRVHVVPEEERPAPEPTETLRVTINETELGKKVRESRRDERVDWEGEGWVVKTWNTESYNVKGGNTSRASRNPPRKYVFRHDGLHYVLYPEICV